MPKITATEYLQKCMDECSDKLADPYFFSSNTLQKNALRVESMRDMSPRCGLKMPEHWPDDVKNRGYGIWLYSGGTAEVFGHCSYADCPRRNGFLRQAPWKHLRKLAQ